MFIAMVVACQVGYTDINNTMCQTFINGTFFNTKQACENELNLNGIPYFESLGSEIAFHACIQIPESA